LEKFFDEKALRKFARGNLRANFVVFCIFWVRKKFMKNDKRFRKILKNISKLKIIKKFKL
jgi:hypothetical protein